MRTSTTYASGLALVPWTHMYIEDTRLNHKADLSKLLSCQKTSARPLLSIHTRSRKVGPEAFLNATWSHASSSMNTKYVCESVIMKELIHFLANSYEVKRKRLAEMKQTVKVAKFQSVIPISGFDFVREPCEGVLLFGPPGKIFIANALANEAGANFISITGSTFTSKVGVGEVQYHGELQGLKLP
ncbi:unnamed protein product [Lactuca saligna]|uniref:ATPase AAA-type core domain-containing protein n=1 Tax=Lactuca saligna TaxID=75948 RepID=A0AA35UTC6_LACSI|nr:unnamed protein product [Lactuca saligna]